MAVSLSPSGLTLGSTTKSDWADVGGGANHWSALNSKNNPVTIRDSHNLSSVSDSGTGDHTVNFSNNFASGLNYSVAGSGNQEHNNTGYYVRMISPINLSNSSFRFFCSHTNASKADFIYIGIQIEGDLA